MNKNIWLIAICFLLTTCHQEDIAFKGCRISSIEVDALVYSFNYLPNGFLNKIETNSKLAYKINYSGNYLSEIITLWDNLAANDGSIQFKANEIGIIESKTSNSKTQFTNNGNFGLISNISFVFDWTNNSGRSYFEENWTIQYSSQNVVLIKDSLRDYSEYKQTAIYQNIKYDDKLNPYRLLAKSINNPNFYFNMADYGDLYIPQYLSINNPISYSIVTNHGTGSWTTKYTFDYKYNAQGFPTEVLVTQDGYLFRRYIKFHYADCGLD